MRFALDAAREGLNLPSMRFVGPLLVFGVFGGSVLLAGSSAGCGGDDEGSSSGTASGSSSGASSGESSGESSGATSSGATSSGATSSGSTSGDPPSPVTITNETLTVAGQARNYLLAVPKTYDAAKTYPLVVVFHGQPGNGVGMHEYYPFEKASGDEAILAYPDGIGSQWNLFDPPAGNTDMRFVSDLVAALKAKYSVDRVFADGWSNGAFFLNQIGCRLGLWTAMSSIAGGAPYDDPDGTTRCTPQGPIPVIVIHGKQDGTVPFGGGEDTVYFWRTENGCADTSTASSPAPCIAYAGCQAGKPVHFCAIDNQNHGIWTESAKAAWAFFKSIP